MIAGLAVGIILSGICAWTMLNSPEHIAGQPVPFFNTPVYPAIGIIVLITMAIMGRILFTEEDDPSR